MTKLTPARGPAAKGKPAPKKSNGFVKLSDFSPQRKNINRGKPHGLAAIDSSMRRDGYSGAAMVAAADKELFIGSKRLERSVDVFGPSINPIVVHSDGTQPVIVIRDDIPTADDPRAQRLGYSDNAIAAMDWNPDGELLAALAADDEAVAALVKQEDASLAALKEYAGEQAMQDAEPQIDRAEELIEKYGVASGQTWKLGEHVLYCGSAEQAHIKCTVAIYDPPFEWGAQQQDNALSWAQWETAVLMGLRPCMPLAARHDFQHWWVWDSGMARFAGRGYKPMSGCAIVFVFGEKRNRFEDQAMQALTRHEIDHYDFPVQVVKVQDSLHNDHEHREKPYPLADYMVSLYSKEGFTIGDPFAGVGSFLVACQNLKRQWQGSEIETGNCAIILDRFERAFSIQPELVQ